MLKYNSILYSYKFINIYNFECDNTIIFSPIINNKEHYFPASMYTLQGKLSDIFNIKGNINLIDTIIPLEKYNGNQKYIGNRNFLYKKYVDWNVFSCNDEQYDMFKPYKLSPTYDNAYVAFYSLLKFLNIQSKINKEMPSYVNDEDKKYYDKYNSYTLEEWKTFPDDYNIYTLNNINYDKK